ncbi:cupin domain-containing protein [Gordonia sp. SL306]|uniref:cupin domain-containing protein n=1 Tax=Gordonia sp. SL306 TaxID=2995145 RepID=UPI003B631AA1
MTDITGHEPGVRSPDDEVVGTDRASMHLLFDASETDDALSTLEVRLQAGADGAAPHFHRRSSEMFYVVDGELRVMTGDRIVTVGVGNSLVVPPLMPHAFGATPDSAARVLIVLTPGVERFEYFRLLARIQAGEATLEELAAVQDEFDNHFVDAPLWWQDRQASRGSDG